MSGCNNKVPYDCTGPKTLSGPSQKKIAYSSFRTQIRWCHYSKSSFGFPYYLEFKNKKYFLNIDLPFEIGASPSHVFVVYIFITLPVITSLLICSSRPAALFPNLVSLFLPQDLCTCCSFFLDCCSTVPRFLRLLKCHRIRKPFLTTDMELPSLPLDIPTAFLCSVSVFIHFLPLTHGTHVSLY